MKIKEIEIAILKKTGGVRKYKVKSFGEFEMFGYKFVAHHLCNYDNIKNEIIEFDDIWVISEATTGAAVNSCGEFSKLDAISEAKMTLKRNGKIGLEKVIKEAKKILQDV